MKVWISAMAGLILFIGLAIYIQDRIQNTSNRFYREINQVNTILVHRQEKNALKKLANIRRKWEKTKPLWAVLIIHREMDSIDESLVRTIKAVQSKDFSVALIELGSLGHYIRHIPERERLSLVNIF